MKEQTEKKGIEGELFQDIFEVIERETNQEQANVREAEARLKGAQEILESLQRRRETLKEEVGKYHELMIKADPGKMEEISRQHAALLAEQPINAGQIQEYETKLLKELSRNLEDVRQALGHKIDTIIIKERDRQNEKLNDIIKNQVEPMVGSWQKITDDIRFRYRLPFSPYIAHYGLKWKNDLVYKACEDQAFDAMMAGHRLAMLSGAK